MSSPVARERWAVAAVFAVHGTVLGTFASRLPWIADHLRLGAGQLGLALSMISVGVLVATPLAGRFVQRFGGRTSTMMTLAAWCTALALPALSQNVMVFGTLLLVFGMTSGTADMAMNAQGIEVEKRLGKSIMSGLHGSWSVGVLVAAFAGSLFARARVDARVHFAVTAGGLLVVGLIAAARLSGPPATVDRPGQQRVPWFCLPKGRVLLIGLVGFCAVFPEVAAHEWSAIFMRRVLGADEASAALATSVFALTMTGGRLGGDLVVRWFGAGRTVRICGLVGATGALLVVVAHTELLAMAGFMLIGAGVSVVVPLSFAAAGHAAASPAVGVAGVATVSYGAGLAAPSVIGGVAAASSLRWSFMVVAILAGLVAAAAGLLDQRPERTGAERTTSDFDLLR
ncbi:MFS transporter [Dactylosporangium sucinum]|uniref:MFS transporter n=1 Tax=Dactylosporangium sucinum TaxID=1424081 RepID=A0A917X5I8_9ACTN|nr:MFS transporter [Dactylosporangium sucinum]GGM71436.1 MFS transporter [Dactylosporangium sucinum]